MTGSACTIIVDIFSLGYLAKVFEYLSIHFIDVVDGNYHLISEYNFVFTLIDLFDDSGVLYIGTTVLPAVCHEVGHRDHRVILYLLHRNPEPFIEGDFCVLADLNLPIRQSGGFFHGIVIAREGGKG